MAGIADVTSDEHYSSDFIENRLQPTYERLKLPAGRLELMTGINERRLWPVGTRSSDLSTMAAKKLLETSTINSQDIDLLIHSSVCRDFLEPATSSVIHSNLKLNDNAMIFDLSNACLGMINSIVVAGNMIESGQIKTALIVSGENASPLLEETIRFLNNGSLDGSINRKNIKKYIANLTIGSAATAILLAHKDDFPDAPKIVGGSVLTDSSANELCQGDGNGHSLMMETDSEALMHKGVNLAIKNWKKAKETLSWENSDLDWVLTHQVGIAHEKMTLESLGVQEVPTFKTFPYLGNTGSSALPITLSHLKDKNLIKKNDKLALMGIGSGLTSIILGIQW
jgi:3-oxoacyl-[acyl-carrier-protein] synthase-3